MADEYKARRVEHRLASLDIATPASLATRSLADMLYRKAQHIASASGL
jgi:hypothetical protein